jgi:hypothetical protein
MMLFITRMNVLSEKRMELSQTIPSMYDYRRRQTIGEIIDKTKSKINQAIGGLSGNKKLKREGRTQGQVESAVNGRILSGGGGYWRSRRG